MTGGDANRPRPPGSTEDDLSAPLARSGSASGGRSTGASIGSGECEGAGFADTGDPGPDALDGRGEGVAGSANTGFGRAAGTASAAAASVADDLAGAAMLDLATAFGGSWAPNA